MIENIKQAALKDVEAVRDLFARAHDYVAQATYPGHMGMKVAEVLNFLAFQYNDFKLRAERLVKELEPVKSTVDVAAAQAATVAAIEAEVIVPEAPKS